MSIKTNTNETAFATLAAEDMLMARDVSGGGQGWTDVASLQTLDTYAVAGVPAAASFPRRIIYVSNGNAGAACLAVSNGTSWLRVVFGAAVAAS